MDSVFLYAAKVTLITGAFYLFYVVMMKKETFFHFNRFFLLFAVLSAVIIPLMKLSWQFEYNYPLIPLIEVDDWLNGIVLNKGTVQETIHSGMDYILVGMIVYFTGVFLLTVRLIVHGIRLLLDIDKNHKYRKEGILFVQAKNEKGLFSFFHIVFLSSRKMNNGEFRKILAHELVHIKQWHSVDRIVMEILVILFWFNPFIYLCRKTIMEVHEYLADKGILKSGMDLVSYQQLILKKVFNTPESRFTSYFNVPLTKKRIIMMNKVKSGIVARLKELLLIPFIAVLFLSFGFDWSTSFVNLPNEGMFNTLVQPDTNKNKPCCAPFKVGVDYKIASGYGMRIHPIQKIEKMHYGVDFTAPLGTPVISTAVGVVEKAEFQEGYGNLVLIRHSEVYSTLYTQLLKYDVQPGDRVSRGDVIGYLGESGTNTGPHLHYEVIKNGDRVNPEDYFQSK